MRRPALNPGFRGSSLRTRLPALQIAAVAFLSGVSVDAQGVIEATLTMGKRVTELRYSRSGDLVRIEELGDPSGPLPPVNLLDLESGGLTIYYPHNSSWVQIPADDLTAPSRPAFGPRRPLPVIPGREAEFPDPPIPGLPPMPELPPGIGPRMGAVGAVGPASVPRLAGGTVSLPPADQRSAVPGPRRAPTIPSMPDPPAIPALPPGVGPDAGQGERPGPGGGDPSPARPPEPVADGAGAAGAGFTMPAPPSLPPGFGPGARVAGVPLGPQSAPAMPRMPKMPDLPPEILARLAAGSEGPEPRRPSMSALPGLPGHRRQALVATDESREFHGVSCTRHTITDPRDGILEIWAAEGLPPFFLLEHQAPRNRGPRDLHEVWPSLLREQGLFPMLAILRDGGGERELMRFEVTSFEPDRAPGAAARFEVPEGYHRIEPPRF